MVNHPKQRVTEADISVGRIRCGVVLKRLLPQEPQLALKFVLRGVALEGHWNPRNGPDRSRSGVLAVGETTLQQLVEADESLVLEVVEGVPHFH